MARNAVLKSFDVSLDLKRSTSNRPFEVVEGDTGNRLVVTVTDNGAAVSCEDMLVLAVFSNSKGTAVQSSSNKSGGIDIDNNVVTIDLFPTSFAPGMVECELQLYSTSVEAGIENVVEADILVTTAKFNFACRRAILNEDTIESTPEFPLLIDLMDTVNEAEAAREAAEAAREAAERSRETAEAERVIAENKRNAAELAREAAEEERCAAEGIRAAAELEREATIAEFEETVGDKLYLIGTADPDASTDGIVGRRYVNITTGDIFVALPGATDSELVWTKLLQVDGDASLVTAIRNSMVFAFQDMPKNVPVSFSELLARLSAWYTRINANTAGLDEKLNIDGDGSEVTVTPIISGIEQMIPFENFKSGETVTLGDALIRLTAWYDKINSMAPGGGNIGDLEELLANKLDIDGDGSAVTATRNMSYIFEDIPTGTPISLAELLARIGGWFSQIKALSISLNDLSTIVQDKLDKNGDASSVTASYSTSTEFTSIPQREAIQLVRLLSILSGWYMQINSNIEEILRLDASKLNYNGDGSEVTVSLNATVLPSFESFESNERIALKDILAKLNAWFTKIRDNCDSITLIENKKLDVDGDGSSVTATPAIKYDGLYDFALGESVTLATVLERLNAWYISIKDTDDEVKQISSLVENKLNKDGDASNASASYSSTTDFTDLPAREAIVFSRLLSTLSGWYAQINANIDGIQQLGTNKLDVNGDGSEITVRLGTGSLPALEAFSQNEMLTLQNVLLKLNAWFSKIMANSGSIDELVSTKLDMDGDGSAVTATRNTSYKFADIPTGMPISLAELLARLGGWYAYIKATSEQLANKLDSSDLENTVNDALLKAKELGIFNGADGYTPIRGADYWTEADKAEIKAYVNAAILEGEW